jgi:BirA family transcriptional regulator, biotin operon repressor / biotin---[acetyl-CoA-carboxylase] ligase
MRLDPRASAAGVRVISHELLPSTNAEALVLARNGERGPLWITAARQNAGRGRRGRSWVSTEGNLFATLLLTDPASPRHWPELAFVAALAVDDAVAEVAPSLESRLAIKWPNDLLLDDAKFGGVLIEAESIEAPAVAVGVGVNCASHPAETDFPATDLAAADATVSPAALFAMLSAKMLGRLAQWNRGEHFAAIRADWLVRAAGLGRTIRLRQTADGELVGLFEGIDEAGRLVLLLPGGCRRRLAAGDVMDIRAMSYSGGGEP